MQPWGGRELGGRRGLLGRGMGQKLPWEVEFCCMLRCGPEPHKPCEPVEGVPNSAVRAILKAKAICGGGRTGRLVKPGKFRTKLSSSMQNKRRVQWRSVPTLPHLASAGAKPRNPARKNFPDDCPLYPSSLTFPEGAEQEPPSSSGSSRACYGLNSQE